MTHTGIKFFDKQIIEMEQAFIKSKSELFNWEVRLEEIKRELKRKNANTKIEEILEGKLTLENIEEDYQSLPSKTKLTRANFEVKRLKRNYVDNFILLKYTKNLKEKFLQGVE